MPCPFMSLVKDFFLDALHSFSGMVSFYPLMDWSEHVRRVQCNALPQKIISMPVLQPERKISLSSILSLSSATRIEAGQTRLTNGVSRGVAFRAVRCTEKLGKSVNARPDLFSAFLPCFLDWASARAVPR